MRALVPKTLGCFGLILLLFTIYPLIVKSQPTDTIAFHPAAEIPYTPFQSSYASLFDRNGRPYLYTANMQAGLYIFDITDFNHPIAIDTLVGAIFHQLSVTNLYQRGDLLFVALGNFQGVSQRPGMAILDVSQIPSISLVGFWESGNLTQGCATAVPEGDYVYLGVMEDGLVILHIADPANILFESQYQPDPTWPNVAPYAPNGRGIAIRNDTVFLAYDAGGLRLIDVADKQHPVQITQYVNTDLTSVALPAYNNIVLKDHYAFITVDYCGLEVVDIGDPENLHPVYWANPWNCQGASWFGSDGHTNQLEEIPSRDLLFVSGADSEVLVYDIADPTLPQLAGSYVMVNDSAATWSLDVFEDKLSLSFINNSLIPILQPYYSDYGGIKLFRWQEVSTALNERPSGSPLQLLLYPNPIISSMLLSYSLASTQAVGLEIYTAEGNLVRSYPERSQYPGRNEWEVDLSPFPSGLYFVILSVNGNIYPVKAFKK